jgi:hypothetical protein
MEEAKMCRDGGCCQPEPNSGLIGLTALFSPIFYSSSSSSVDPAGQMNPAVFPSFLFDFFFVLSSTFIQDFNCANCNLALCDTHVLPAHYPAGGRLAAFKSGV